MTRPDMPKAQIIYGEVIYWLCIIAAAICTIGPIISLWFVDNNVLNPHYVFAALWEGKSAEEIIADNNEALIHFWKDPISNTPPDAEPLLDFEKRVISSWKQIINDAYTDQRILIVTHGGVISTILCNLYKKPINHILEFQVSHASVVQIVIDQKLNQTIINGVTI